MTTKAHASGRPVRLPSGRGIAEIALARVLDDGAFAAAALEAEIERHPQLGARERALATTLLYGTLRVFPWLESRLDEHAKKSVTKLRPRVRAALAIATYQLLLLDRIPDHAAVNAAVESVRDASDSRVAGFANAILRKVAAAASSGERTPVVEALRASIPRWLVASMTATLGEDGVVQLLESSVDAPPFGLFVPDAGSRDAWLTRLQAESPNASVAPGRASPHAVLVRGAGRPRDIPGVATGELVVQEEGSQVVGLALGVRPGERVLDACAGRGHKTALFARAAGAGGRVDAADLHENKLARLHEELAQLGLAPGATYAVDWSVGGGDVPRDYDAVLVDAPCSGTGTLRRRPDIMLRRTKASVVELATLQTAILQRAAEHVRVGGRLIYAVCSFLREEAEDVLARADLATLGFAPAPFAGAVGRNLFANSTTARLLPHLHGTDGYFLASFARSSL